MTPSILSKGGSMHQKQPPANVATASPAAGGAACCVALARLKVGAALKGERQRAEPARTVEREAASSGGARPGWNFIATPFMQ